MSKLQLIVEQLGAETRVRFAAAKIADKPNIEALADDLAHLVNRLDRPMLCLDFANVEYLSSYALAKLVALQKQVQTRDGSLRLCNVSAKVYHVFEIAKLETVFEIEVGVVPGSPP